MLVSKTKTIDKSPFFSVVLPTYNRSTLLKKAIFSVVNQKFKDWELIIIDDGSTDDTYKIITPLLEKHKNISYLWQENQGKGGVRNAGISIAQGTYITFLDDDDYLLSNHLKTFWNILRSAPKNAIIKSEGYLEEKSKLTPLTVYPHDNLKNVIKNIWEVGAHLSSFCIPKYIFDHFQFDRNLFFAQDYHLILRILLNHNNIAFSHERTFVIVNHPDRGTYKIDEVTFEQLYNSRFSIYKYFIEEEKQQLLKYLSSSEIKKKAVNDYLYLANYAARLRKYQLMFSLVFRSLRLFKIDLTILRKLAAVFYQAILNRKST